jgi:hypothetical protein
MQLVILVSAANYSSIKEKSKGVKRLIVKVLLKPFPKGNKEKRVIKAGEGLSGNVLEIINKLLNKNKLPIMIDAIEISSAAESGMEREICFSFDIIDYAALVAGVYHNRKRFDSIKELDRAFSVFDKMGVERVLKVINLKSQDLIDELITVIVSVYEDTIIKFINKQLKKNGLELTLAGLEAGKLTDEDQTWKDTLPGPGGCD